MSSDTLRRPEQHTELSGEVRGHTILTSCDNSDLPLVTSPPRLISANRLALWAAVSPALLAEGASVGGWIAGGGGGGGPPPVGGDGAAATAESSAPYREEDVGGGGGEMKVSISDLRYLITTKQVTTTPHMAQ